MCAQKLIFFAKPAPVMVEELQRFSAFWNKSDDFEHIEQSRILPNASST
jgi:hypothetical protein